MLRWLLGRRRLHLYAGYVSARRIIPGSVETAMAPLVVVSSRKSLAVETGREWLRSHCPVEHHWVDQQVEFMQVPDVLVRAPQLVICEGLTFDAKLRISASEQAAH
jgi:hypothetical protein